LENPGFSEFEKISRKKFGNKFGSKNPVFEAKTGVLGSKTGVSKYFEFKVFSEFVLFRIFQKLPKNDIKIDFFYFDRLVVLC